jgi:hypothetical protein
MWLGKIAWIMYLFSLSTLFMGYYVGSVFGQGIFTTVTVSGSNSTSTQNTFDYLNSLVNKHKINEALLPDLIFGDFVTVSKIIFGVITGEPIAAVISAFPNFDAVWALFFRIIFTISSVALWGYIIAGRML